MAICFSVVGFTNDPENLQINEGDGGTLTVGFLKPPAGVDEMASVSFTIDNSQNTGMLHNAYSFKPKHS